MTSTRRLKDEKIVGHLLAEVMPEDRGRWWTIPHLKRLNGLIFILLLSATTAGFDGSMMNGLQSLPVWRNYFGKPVGVHLGLINAIYPIGAVVSLPITSILSDKFGRKFPIYFGLIGILVASALQAATQNYAMLVVTRLIVGYFSVTAQAASPVLLTELAYPTHRGRLTYLSNSFYFCGSVIAAWVTFGTRRIQSNACWRIPSALQVLCPLIQLSLLHLVPESPRWLVSRGRTVEAQAFLAEYHCGGDQDHPLVQREVLEIQETIRLEKENTNDQSWLSLLKTPGNRKRVAVGIMTGAWCQLNGTLVVDYYLTLMLDSVGITSATSQTLINACLQCLRWFTAIAGAQLVDVLGRRPLFLISVASMLVSWMSLTTCAGVFANDPDNHAAADAFVAFVFIFAMAFACCWVNMIVAYPVEIFPFELRTKGVALTLATNYSFNFASLFTNPVGMKNIGWKYYIVFDGFLVVIFTTIYFFFPETKGFSLEEIAKVFDGDKAVPDEEIINRASRKQLERDGDAESETKAANTVQIEQADG
ncbi:hypothetical protein AYO21_08663 [Fonsecaea monophora]|uniref:Major facilitator superfamily (MFS) profile domain-containing protein n=1 Tax=Fonsecaea monophora TaxID=254056 RepID=A0A177EYS8_9EURO|nr:hypothetical protein AYO21_08663 [Fonsecaea monophora]OAG37128.1 hypothetical protein AYO21_08663 [Fonsecaea monophora]